jgi:hypothetical protein
MASLRGLRDFMRAHKDDLEIKTLANKRTAKCVYLAENRDEIKSAMKASQDFAKSKLGSAQATEYVSKIWDDLAPEIRERCEAASAESRAELARRIAAWRPIGRSALPNGWEAVPVPGRKIHYFNETLGLACAAKPFLLSEKANREALKKAKADKKKSKTVK